MLKNKKSNVIKVAIVLIIFICVMIGMGVIIYGTDTTTYTTADGNYRYSILEDDTIEITRYLGTETEVIIPSTINEKTVTSIGSSAFSGYSSLTSIELPEEITSIGSYAFSECSSLTSIELPDGITNIGRAFYNCSSLTSIVIPGTVTSIEEYAFYGCSSLTDIDVVYYNEYYSSKDGVLFNKKQTELMHYPAGKQENNYIVPDGVKSIEDAAFYGCSILTSIEFPESLTYLGPYAFKECSNLKSLVIPGDIMGFGISIFEGCDNLIIYLRTSDSWFENSGLTYVIDDGAPTIESITGNPTEAIDEDVTLTINGAEDSVVGLANKPYSFDGGETWQKENTKTYTENTEGIIIQVKDKLGNTYTHETINITNISRMTSEKYEIGEEYITKITPSTLVSDFRTNIETNATEVKIYNKDNEEVSEDTKLVTGMRVELKIGEETKTFAIVVTGDTDGDGDADFTDLTIVNAYRLGKLTDLEEVFVQAGDLTGDGQVEFGDLVKLNAIRLGKILNN